MFVVLESGWFDPERLEVKQAGRQPTPKMGGSLLPRYIVLHASGSTTLETALSLIADTSLTYSMHLVVDRDGSVVQCVPFMEQAWHCGKSRWGFIKGLNSHAIGIEMINAGRLRQVGGRYRTWWGTKVPPGDVYVHDDDSVWHAYTETQILTVLEICRALCAYYPIDGVMGRDEVCTAQVLGPGPAFPMQAFQDLFGNRADDAYSAYITVQPTPMHVAPDLRSPLVDMPLLMDSVVTQEGDAPGGWVMVICHEYDGQPADTICGWVKRYNLDFFQPPDYEITLGMNGKHGPLDPGGEPPLLGPEDELDFDDDEEC